MERSSQASRGHSGASPHRHVRTLRPVSRTLALGVRRSVPFQLSKCRAIGRALVCDSFGWGSAVLHQKFANELSSRSPVPLDVNQKPQGYRLRHRRRAASTSADHQSERTFHPSATGYEASNAAPAAGAQSRVQRRVPITGQSRRIFRLHVQRGVRRHPGSCG